MKSILVYLDASPRAAVRLAMAQKLAARDDSELDTLYGVVPSMLAWPWITGDGMAAAVSALADFDRELHARARATAEAARAQGRLRWLEGGSSPYWKLLQQALYADLVVFGQTDVDDQRTGALPPNLVATAIIDTGKPTLVVPCAGTFEALPSKVLIAWKPTREAARAVNAALPWLRRADAVHIAARPEEDDGDIDAVAKLRHWLLLHDVAAVPQAHDLGPGDIGDGLLSLAADTDADLLVMGCYGHGRAQEWVLGGASRSVLQTMTLPVLMAH